MNLNLSRISAETKISDLSKISAEIWLRLETFRESGPWFQTQRQDFCLKFLKHFKLTPWAQTIWILRIVSVSALAEPLA